MTRFAFSRLTLFGILTIALVLIASSCSMPVSVAPTPSAEQELTPDTIYTSAVQTVIAQLTESAPTLQPTPTQSLPEPTPVMADTPVPTELPSPTPLSTATPANTPTSQPEPTTIPPATDPTLNLGLPDWEDTFENDENWALVSDEHSQFVVRDKQLVMVAYNADFWNSWGMTPDSLEVFYLEAEASSSTCAGRDRWGLLFRAPDYTRGYLFGLSCDGRYALWIWTGSSEIYLVEWTESPHILKGPDQVNRLGVKADGNRLSLYANGNLLEEVRDDYSALGRFGLFIGASDTPGYTVKVDRIAYWQNP